jgi:probable rRNA maturation factor
MFTNFENMPVQADKVIKFFFLSKSITLKDRKRLKNFLVGLLRKEGRKAAYVNYIFCSDSYLLEINRQYLKHDYYTDIITFDLSAESNLLEAEIYISVDRIRDNAKTLNTTLREETLRVMFHGLLHLCGYGDKTAGEKKRMREREDYYLKRFNS